MIYNIVMANEIVHWRRKLIYANDLHVYAHFDLNHSALVAAVKQMEDGLDELKVWMARNSMCMNDGKT